MRSAGPRLEKNGFLTEIPRRCICGGRVGRWLRRGRCCGLRWWMNPSAHPDRFPTEEDQAEERRRLFGILEQLVVWENSNNAEVLAEARARAPRSHAAGSCRMCWIRSVGVGRSRWRHSGSGCLRLGVI